MPIQGSIVLDFGEGVSDDSFVVIELDDEVNIDSEGDIITTFLPEGETAGFIVHFDKKELKVSGVSCSSGSVESEGETIRSRTSQVQFVKFKEKVTLPYLPDGDVSFEWYAEGGGNEPGIVMSARDMLPQGSIPAIGEASFNIRCQAFTLAPPSGLEIEEDESYPVLCVVTMEEV